MLIKINKVQQLAKNPITVTNNRETMSGLYCCAKPKLDSGLQSLRDYCSDIGLPSNELIDAPHVTCCYSKESPTELPEAFFVNEAARIHKIEHWDGHDGIGYVVAHLISPSLVAINKELVACGGIAANYNEYKPHMTLAKDVGGLTPELQSVIYNANQNLPRCKISFDSIHYEDLKD